MAAALLGVPANPQVPRRRLPGRRTEQQASQRPAVLGPGQILQVLAHAIAMLQIVVALQKAPEERSLRTPFIKRLHSHRLQGLQRAYNGAMVVVQRCGLPITQAVDRGSSSWRQRDLPLGLQLQKQTPTGHVLELARTVTPVPGGSKVAGQPRAIRVGMSFQPVSNQRDLFGADQPPLNGLRSVHGLRSSRREKLSPEKNEKKFSTKPEVLRVERKISSNLTAGCRP